MLINIVYIIFILSLGAVCGYIGICGEATVLTDKSVRTAMYQGAAVTTIVTFIFTSIFGVQVVGSVGIGALFGIGRMEYIQPIVNAIIEKIRNFESSHSSGK